MESPSPRPDLHPLALRFIDPGLERAYQAEAVADARLPFRVAGFLAIAVFAIVALVAVALAPVPPGLAVPACALMIAVVAAGLRVAARARTLDELQVVGATQNVLAGLVAVAVPYLAGEIERFGAQAVLFAVLWAFVVLRLRFVAAALSVSTYVGVFTVLEWAGPHPSGLLLVLLPLYASVVALAAAAYLLEQSVRLQFHDRLVISGQRHELAVEKAKSDRLLLNVLPAAIAERLRERTGPGEPDEGEPWRGGGEAGQVADGSGPGSGSVADGNGPGSTAQGGPGSGSVVDGSGPRRIADGFADATILFADIVGFTPLAEAWTPEQIVDVLDALFSSFDDLSDHHGLEKIKTIGDAYMVVGGVPTPTPDHAERVVAMALGMLEHVAVVGARTGLPLHLRIGVHSGPVVAGVIGKRKFAYDLWGDTVNTASRLESSGLADRIQVSAETRARLGGRFGLEPRGKVEIKGKGLLETWLVAVGGEAVGEAR